MLFRGWVKVEEGSAGFLMRQDFSRGHAMNGNIGRERQVKETDAIRAGRGHLGLCQVVNGDYLRAGCRSRGLKYEGQRQEKQDEKQMNFHGIFLSASF